MAVSISLPDLATAAGISAAEATRLLPVATEIVQRYAPLAPSVIQTEAAVRVCGWLAQTPKSTLRRLTTGSVTISHAATGTRSALRSSGAMSLLSPYKKRRAGIIG